MAAIFRSENLLSSIGVPVFVKKYIQLFNGSKYLVSTINSNRWVPYINQYQVFPNELRQIVSNSVLSVILDVPDNFVSTFDDSDYVGTIKLYDCGFPLSSEFDQVTKARFRREIRRRLKKLHEIGVVEFQHTEPKNDSCDSINSIVQLLRKARSERGVPSRWSFPNNEAGLREICCAEGSKMFSLQLEGKIIAAAQCQLVDGQTLMYMIPVFDAQYSKLSPSMILLEHIFKYCSDNNLRIDLGKGVGGYKGNFESEVYSLHALVCCNGIFANLVGPVFRYCLSVLIARGRKKSVITLKKAVDE